MDRRIPDGHPTIIMGSLSEGGPRGSGTRSTLGNLGEPRGTLGSIGES